MQLATLRSHKPEVVVVQLENQVVSVMVSIARNDSFGGVT